MIEHKFSLHFAPACRSADRAENGTCNGAGQGLGRTDAMDGGTAEVGLLTAGSGREIGVLQTAFTDFQENVTGCQHNEGTCLAQTGSMRHWSAHRIAHSSSSLSFRHEFMDVRGSRPMRLSS
jgi:hypothetical protein